jgi:hypothetical protein
MFTTHISQCFTTLLAELVNGAPESHGAFILNPGDRGLLRSLDELSAGEASRSVQDGATVAAHAQHVRYGLSLMNRWICEGGNPFANARWDEAWKVSAVNATEWAEIRAGLHREVTAWLSAIRSPRDVTPFELTGIAGSIAHLAYHFGAIRQIVPATRGPREGTAPAATIGGSP